MKLQRRERDGSALVVVTLLLVVFAGATAVLINNTSLGSRQVMDQRAALQAEALAEAGVGLKLLEMGEGDIQPIELTGPAGTVAVEVVAEGDSGYHRLVATSQSALPGSAQYVERAVEAYAALRYHPFLYRATFVANSDEVPDYVLNLGPGSGAPTVTPGRTFNENAWRYKREELSESELGVDLDGDGDLDDTFSLQRLWSKRKKWDWSRYLERAPFSRNYYRLDIDRDGAFTQIVEPASVVPATFRDPLLDAVPPLPSPDWATVAKTADADYIEWDFYVNGDVNLLGATNVFGEVSATGVVNGRPVGGQVIEGHPVIPPPDLSAMNYEQLADRIVTTSSIPSWMRGEQSSSYYGSDLGARGSHDNPYFHLGRRGGSVPLTGSDPGTLVRVKGNLWLHDTSSFTIDLPRNRQTLLTVVVEGNLYVADDLQYNREDSGVLFIVKADESNPESYVDENHNYRYDVGEQLIDDDGDGRYEGPIEGQGNVVFGDPRFGTGGVTDGYIYAQNNVYLVNPPPSIQAPLGQDAIWGVYGFLSAGGILDLGERELGVNYQNVRIKYDERLDQGAISFVGMPPAPGEGGGLGLTVVSWRQLR